MASTALLALGIRYGLMLDRVLFEYAAATAFALATIASSFLTYGLNAAFTFRASNDQ
jgi:putative flippase GtrA